MSHARSRLLADLTERLGVTWIEVIKRAGRRAVREIDGAPIELITGFSRRSTQIEAGYDHLVADYVKTYGYTPPRSVQMKLAQQATLAEQIAEWRNAAAAMLPGKDVDAVLAAALHQAAGAAVTTLGPDELAELAARVVDVVSKDRATWTVYHARAEAIRQLEPRTFATMADREHAVEQVVAAALGSESIELAVALTLPPALLQRVSGESIYYRHGSTRYTSHIILDA